MRIRFRVGGPMMMSMRVRMSTMMRMSISISMRMHMSMRMSMSMSMRIRFRVGGQTRVAAFSHHSLEGQASNICDEALQPCGLARRGVAVEALEEYLFIGCPLPVMCSPCNPEDRTNRVTHDSVREALT